MREKQVRTGPVRDERGRFLKGVSGNPKGRPPLGESWAEAVRAAATPAEKQKVVRAMLEAAKAGSVHAAIYLRDTQDGRPPQRTILSGDAEAPPIFITRDPREHDDG